MKKVALSFAPAGAIEEVREAAKIVTTKKGGEGAVREAIDYVLKENAKVDTYKRESRSYTKSAITQHVREGRNPSLHERVQRFSVKFKAHTHFNYNYENLLR
jgi:hypothetical protein